MSADAEKDAALTDELMAVRWAEVRIGNALLGQICPLCSALVAAGSGEDRPHKNQHVYSHTRVFPPAVGDAGVTA